jgi:threonine dehydrogenase-like Zn-dependent dehydrogenase
MKATAAVVTAPRTAVLNQQRLGELPPGGLRIRLQGCGVCGSNLPVWEGRPWFRYPLEPGAPGHEGWGLIDAVGADVSMLRPGMRVATLALNAFAEYAVTEATHAVQLPPQLDRQPFPGEALGCAINVFRRADVHQGQTVAVVGIGFLGALLVSLASRAGAKVLAVGRRPFALQMARLMGAEEVFEMGDAGTLSEIMELTRGQGCPRVIEATGLQGPLDLASDLCSERGRLVIAGYHQDGLRQVNLQSWNWRGLDVINAHERDPAVSLQGMQAAVDAIINQQLDPTPLYTHRFGLDDIAQALDTLRDRPSDFLKALLIYE